MLVGVRTSPVLPNIRQFLDCQISDDWYNTFRSRQVLSYKSLLV